MTDTRPTGVILIVDDTPSSAGALVDYLSDSGFKVLVAREGESAIEQAQYASPDIILLDVLMNGIDGFETCRRLKANETTKEIPVIFMTALSETVDKLKGFDLGAVDYVTKPIQHEEVLARVGTHLTLRNLQKRLREARDQLELRVQDRTAELSQANALLKSEVAERERAEEELRLITEGTASVTGTDFFHSLVRHLARTFKVRHAFVTECTDVAMTRVRTLALTERHEIRENIEYDLQGTPCEKVVAGQVCCYPDKLESLFPREVGMQSFLGIPFHDSRGQIIGHLAVMDDKPMSSEPRGLSILRIFAARAGAELERKRAEEALREALAEVQKLKDRLHAENVYLQEEIREEYNFEEIVGSSPALLGLLGKVEKVAPAGSTVLIYGETGTGKELIARALHNRSPRKDRPLVKVNCAALSAGLVESELFGHVKGAFTGALENREGRFKLADGGTLFLDEVGELPLETQVKLLRVLQEQEFEPVGSSRTIRVNVRIIAATNRNLEEAVRASRFRSDLFYRLNIFPLTVPPLRERPSDLPQLVMFFLHRFSKKLGKKLEAVSRETMDLLVSYSWPGNVRELQNIIERAVVLSQGSVLTLDRDLLPTFEAAKEDGHAAASVVATTASSWLGHRAALPAQGSTSAQMPLSLEEVEQRHILAVLGQTGWVIEGPKGAAKVLNLHPNTLRSRMKKLGIRRS